jgi:hypothetical protein
MARASGTDVLLQGRIVEEGAMMAPFFCHLLGLGAVMRY